MRETARRAFVASLVVGAVVVGALALWKLKLLLVLLFLAFTIAAAMRPGVEALSRRGVPRVAGILLHYLAIAALVALLLWLVIPRVLEEVQVALGSASRRGGLWEEALVGVRAWLERLPPIESLVTPALEVTVRAFEVLVGIVFVLASAAYWIYERDTVERLVLSLVPRERRRVVRDTWELVDLKLGAYVRGQLLLIIFVATVLSVCFWAIGLPYWILLAVFAGVVELIPVIGPLTAGAFAVAVGLTVSWQLALAAGLIVLVVRLLEDYLVIPRVLGHAVGLSSLLVLVSVAATAILFGGFAVLLAIPLAAVVATLVDVIVRHRDPAKEEVPTVIFPAKDAQAGSAE
jgi:predicted PurR-regulated permease PerM